MNPREQTFLEPGQPAQMGAQHMEPEGGLPTARQPNWPQQTMNYAMNPQSNFNAPSQLPNYFAAQQQFGVQPTRQVACEQQMQAQQVPPAAPQAKEIQTNPSKAEGGTWEDRFMAFASRLYKRDSRKTGKIPVLHQFKSLMP